MAYPWTPNFLATMTLLDTLSPPLMERTRQTAPQIYESLRELILAVELKPGSVLNRLELAQHYGVSQTPVRDALQRLSEDGLVEVYAQHATLVSRIRPQDAQQALFLRRSVELEILQQLCKAPQALREALLASLRANLAEQTRSVETGDVIGLQALDQAFHRLQYEAAGVLPLWNLVRRQSVHIDRLRRLNLPKEGKARAVLADHQRILEALAQGKLDQAQAALRQHLSGTLAFIDEVRERFPEYLAG